MKKFSAIVLVILMIFALAACGGSPASGNSSDGSVPSAAQSTPAPSSSTPDVSSAPDTSTPASSFGVDDFLAPFGLTEDDLRPEEGAIAAIDPGAAGTGIHFDNQTQSAGYNKTQHYTKIYEAIQRASDDGMVWDAIITNREVGTPDPSYEITLDYILGRPEDGFTDVYYYYQGEPIMMRFYWSTYTSGADVSVVFVVGFTKF